MIHTFDPDAQGRCQAIHIGNDGRAIVCRSIQRSSVLHDDPMSAFRERHHHGSGTVLRLDRGRMVAVPYSRRR